MKRSILLITLPLILLCSCHKNNKMFDPRQVDFSVAYDPLFDGQLYPSLILGLNNASADSRQATFEISLTAPRDNCVLRVVVDSSSLNYVTIFQEVLPHHGQTYTFTPTLKWKYDQLRKLRQVGAVDLTFTLFLNDEEVDVKNLHLNYRTVNECPLSLRANGQTVDYRWLFAAYVNEDHPVIEQILTEVIEQGNVSRLAGYQGTEAEVNKQVFAIWYYVLNRGITYSSISCTSNPSPNANVQHIRFFDEVYNTRQANCIDACVFFASILRKIGIKPVIFVEPCHAYLGYYSDKKRRHLHLLETTITSWVNFPELDKAVDSEGMLDSVRYQKVEKYLSAKDIKRYADGKLPYDELKRVVAQSLFDKAADYDRETYNANRKLFTDTSAMTYQQLDIEQLRRNVQPIN
ncbi:MAG: hypothetical protein IJ761_07675 [Bacteroidales bacterium]|nr:hypothetical protein [Bacteroidales bacterium]